ncbi:unnamed protein product [Closterium sp. Yama58-4]|nr:unnamed protein product [Closterium sp. Yama58-4]
MERVNLPGDATTAAIAVLPPSEGGPAMRLSASGTSLPCQMAATPQDPKLSGVPEARAANPKLEHVDEDETLEDNNDADDGTQAVGVSVPAYACQEGTKVTMAEQTPEEVEVADGTGNLVESISRNDVTETGFPVQDQVVANEDGGADTDSDTGAVNEYLAAVRARDAVLNNVIRLQLVSLNIELISIMHGEAGLDQAMRDMWNTISATHAMIAQPDGNPPASQAAVAALPAVFVHLEDVESGAACCTVCNDVAEVGEEVVRLPCRHLYHGPCIRQWLGMRNTCPMCRFELPTDDIVYEARRGLMASQQAQRRQEGQ